MNYKIVQRQSRKAKGWKSWSIVFDDKNLKKENKHVYYATQLEAREKAQVIAKAKLNNRHVPKEKIQTLEFVAEIWKETVLNSDLSQDTINKRVHFVKILPEYPIAQIPCNDVKMKDVEAFYVSLKKDRNITRKTISNYHTQMKKLFHWAVKNEYASVAPLDPEMVTEIFPKNDSKVFNVESISEENIVKIQNAIFDDTFTQTMFLTAIKTGMRLGEQLALTWADIDFENKSISINKNIGEGEGTKADKLKGRNSGLGRVIPMNVELTVALQEWKMETKYSKPSDIVFTRNGPKYENWNRKLWKQRNMKDYQEVDHRGTIGHNSSFYHGGEPATYQTARYIIEQAIKTANMHGEGVIKITWHDLRHYVASKLIVTNGFGEEDLKKISNFLGHEEISTTQRVYAHLIALQGHQDEKTQEMVASL